KIKKYVQEKCACPVDTGVITKEVSYSVKELEKKLEKAPENSTEKRDKKLDMETSEEEQPRGLKIVKAFLAVIALINILLIVCLLFNILTYDYMRYLFITMGLLIFNTIIYMNVQKEESPDEMMQAYFEEQENEKWEKQEQINSRSEKKTVIYGETTVLSEGEKDFTKELLIEEEEERHLYLEALEQGKYDPIHIHNSVVLGCMEEGCNYILKERGISRMHAKLMEKADGLYLLDLNSTNGTYLNGQMLESGEDYKIEEGDHIAFAKSEFYAALEI
ncbi:MAG: FHA domain-containing protein, partial [Lachnospiraceae bacterium]|nr:FHA domain-containing protein [Lachnospiraceae bacterium]